MNLGLFILNIKKVCRGYIECSRYNYNVLEKLRYQLLIGFNETHITRHISFISAFGYAGTRCVDTK